MLSSSKTTVDTIHQSNLKQCLSSLSKFVSVNALSSVLNVHWQKLSPILQSYFETKLTHKGLDFCREKRPLVGTKQHSIVAIFWQFAPKTWARARRFGSFSHHVPGFHFGLQALHPLQEKREWGYQYLLRYHCFLYTSLHKDFLFYSFF